MYYKYSMKEVKIQIRMKRKIVERLDTLAKRNGKDRSKYIRKLLERHIRESAE